MNNISIRYKLLIIVIGTIISVSVILTAKSIYELKELTANNIEEYQKRAFDEQIEQIKDYTAFALNIEKMLMKNQKLRILKQIKVHI